MRYYHFDYFDGTLRQEGNMVLFAFAVITLELNHLNHPESPKVNNVIPFRKNKD